MDMDKPKEEGDEASAYRALLPARRPVTDARASRERPARLVPAGGDLVFGAITYQFFTKGYYPDAPQLVARLGLWFWVIQIGRGTLMTLAVLPVIRTLRMSRVQAAFAVGLLVWVAGGAAPLLLPNPLM